MNQPRNIISCSYSIMSRRKQSNPKPLLKRDDEEAGEGEEATTATTSQTDTDEMTTTEAQSPKSESSKNDSAESPLDSNSPLDLHSHTLKCSKSGEKRALESDNEGNSLSPIPMAKIMPTLRLNTALASDPATNPDAKDISNRHVKTEENKSDDEDFIDNNDDTESNNLVANIKSQQQQQQQQQHQQQQQQQQQQSQKPQENMNSVKAMLVQNLELLPRPNVFFCTPCGIRFSSLSTLEAHQTYYCSHRKIPDETSQKSADGTASGEANGNEPPTKSIKTGKQYACSQCSYSADKKVSLNRHMRMHQTSPSPSSTTSNGDENPAQILVQQTVGAAPQQIVVDRYCTDCDIRFSNTKTYRAHKQHYCSSRHREGIPNNSSTPTTPTTVLPKSSGQKSGSQSPPETAKTPPASAQQPFLALPTNPIIIIPYGLIRNASVIPGPLTTIAPNVANPDSACFIFQNGSLQPIAISLAPVPTSSNSTQAQSSVPSRTPSTTPQAINDINLIAKKISASNATGEILKIINKRDGSGKETSTPLDLSVRRFSHGSNSRERSLSLSSAISADHFRMEFDAMMEGKENISVSGESITPEQIVCAPSLPGSPPLTPSPKRRSHSPRGGSISISPNSSNSHSLLMRPLLPADIALRLSDPSLNVIPPQMLVKQSMELALRLSSAGSNDTNHQQISPLLNLQQQPLTSPSANHISPVVTPTIPPPQPQIFVKTGISKCKECNIVFCKLENYLAHKKHYCSARNNVIEDGDGGIKSPPTSPSQTTTTSPSGVQLPYQQLICMACGIKFTSWDNLNAHQMYYCPKRTELQAQAAATVTIPAHKEKCLKCKSTHDPQQPCTVAGQGAYKCPICEVISPNSTEARRHMETHGGVKAFRCTICRYKGNTLRGMRTHIRMHLDKKSNDINEEHYISCILQDDSTEIPPLGASIVASATSPGIVEQTNVQQLFNCESCNYSSTSKGNVIRHTKLVHPIPQSPISRDGDDSVTINGSSRSTTPMENSIKLEPEEDAPEELLKSEDEETIVDEPSLIPENIIKIEINDKHDSSKSPSPTFSAGSPKQSLKRRSMNSNHSVLGLLPPKIPSPMIETMHLSIKSPSNHSNQNSNSPPNVDMNLLSPNGSKYCKTCDITFTYANTFIAHKKFYCKANKVEVVGRPNSGPSPTASVVVTRGAETSVL